VVSGVVTSIWPAPPRDESGPLASPGNLELVARLKRFVSRNRPYVYARIYGEWSREQ
jgi:hypothetical protein